MWKVKTKMKLLFYVNDSYEVIYCFNSLFFAFATFFFRRTKTLHLCEAFRTFSIGKYIIFALLSFCHPIYAWIHKIFAWKLIMFFHLRGFKPSQLLFLKRETLASLWWWWWRRLKKKNEKKGEFVSLFSFPTIISKKVDSISIRKMLNVKHFFVPFLRSSTSFLYWDRNTNKQTKKNL